MKRVLFTMLALVLALGLALPMAIPVLADDTGYKFPATLGYATGSTGQAPSNPGQAVADDVAIGSTDDSLCALFKTNNPGGGGGVADSEYYYGFTFGIPSGATIDGIEVVVDGYRTGTTSSGAYFRVSLQDMDSAWTDYKDTLELTTLDALYTLGNSGDDWGGNWDSFSDASFKLEIIPAGPYLTGELWKLDSVSVKVYYTPPSSDLTGQFRTQTQGGWGQGASGDNPGTYRDANFAAAFPSGLVIGDSGGHTATFTTAAAIEAFLPAGGTPGTLGADYTNPTETNAGVLAGQVVALTLNVGFDLYDPDFSASATNLKDLVIVDTESPFEGWTVEEVLDEANDFLAGFGSSYTASQINECVDTINKNFKDGTVDNGFLGLP